MLTGFTVQPLQRATQRAAATAADEETLFPHQCANTGKGFLVGCFYPYINVPRITRKDIWEKIIPNAFNDIALASRLLVESVRQGEHASFLENEFRLSLVANKWKLTGSTPMTTHFGLCVFLIARDTPLRVPPVPAPATKTSTLCEDGLKSVEGVETTASIISGPVVYS
jgi:hypothetical protein